MKNKTIRFFLDDIRNPEDVYKYTKLSIYLEDWLIVRDYDSFIRAILYHGIPDTISYVHDLGDLNTPGTEKTGYDCAKWLVNHFYDKNPDWEKLGRIQKKSLKFNFPSVYTHSANPIGSANIMGYVNNFLMNEGQQQTCIRVQISHTTN